MQCRPALFTKYKPYLIFNLPSNRGLGDMMARRQMLAKCSRIIIAKGDWLMMTEEKDKGNIPSLSILQCP